MVSTLAQGQPEQTPELERIRALGMEAVEKMRAVIDDMARGIEALASEAAPPDFIPPPEPEPEPSADDVNAQIAAIKERLNQETP